MIVATTMLLAFLLVYLVTAGNGFTSVLFGNNGNKERTTRIPSSALPATTKSLQRSWEDLAPPFNMQERSTSSSSSKYQDALEDEQVDVTHFCFLVHGHRGLSKDLSYLQAVMQSLAQEEKHKVHYRENNNGKAAMIRRQDLIVHNCICNEGKTTDGVTNGGERLVQEMLTTIREMSNRTSCKQVTVSVVGNSLGGLYGRYAIAKLAQHYQVVLPSSPSSSSESLSDKDDDHGDDLSVKFNIFCTTATPHLGISKHTYFPLSRSAENVVANALGDTGKDLFRLNDLMKTMATSDEYIAPLGAFRKRIAYANAYGTDFPVPAETAAFLSDQSTYPHHFALEEQEQDDDSCDRLVVDSDSGLVIATLHTPPNHDGGGSCLNEQHEDELVRMSTRLDALGWKKVFVDIRKEVPRIAIPRRLSEGLLRRGSSMLSNSLKGSGTADELSSSQRSNHNNNNSEQDAADVTTSTAAAAASIRDLKQKRVVESRDVAKSVKEDAADPYHRLHLPVGHNMIVAFSRSRISTFMNKGGRPVVDALAKELVEDIFAWKKEEETEDDPSS